MNHALGLFIQSFKTVPFDNNFYEATKYFKRSFNKW
ncbi:MAG: hypothetical protein ACJAT5_000806 [Lentimonas sp.]|jgi:hypothetical protein